MTNEVCEAEEGGIRYILRRNPVRVEEMAKSRLSKRRALEECVSKKNVYLSEHPRARVSTAIGKVKNKMTLLRQEKWLSVKARDRQLSLEQDDAVFKEESLLDGCYVIQTDLAKEVADKQLVHDRYKDLAEVEKAFRDCKTMKKIKDKGGWFGVCPPCADYFGATGSDKYDWVELAGGDWLMKNMQDS